MKRNNHLISVCIPTYEMRGLGSKFLNQSLSILAEQSFKDFDVVISDYSVDNSIKNICKLYSKKLDIKYFKNKNTSINHAARMSANTNNAIQHATGKLIKLLFLDDYLCGNKALEITARDFNLKEDHWMVSACEHTIDGKHLIRPYYPKYNNKIHLGNNTISSPSVLTIKNENPLLFDQNLTWLMDCDYYKRCYEEFGLPKVVNEITVVNRMGQHQISNSTTKMLKKKEYQYVKDKFKQKKNTSINLDTVTLVSVSGIDTKGAIKALEESMNGIEYHQVMLISHQKPKNLNKKIVFKKCRPDQLRTKDPKNTNDYSKFIAYYLGDYIKSDYALIVHNNAHVLRPLKWRNAFLKYDYIGAPWPKDLHFTDDGENIRVGNGGFSLRSRKLLKALRALKLPFTDKNTGYFHEDGVICVYYRKQLEEYGIKFAPISIATKFSGEIQCDDSDPEPFGFHDNRNFAPSFYFIKSFIKKIISL